MTKMLSTREVQKVLADAGLSYSIEHISRMIKKGYFPGAVKGPGVTSRWRIPQKSVDEFIGTRITRVETERDGWN